MPHSRPQVTLRSLLLVVSGAVAGSAATVAVQAWRNRGEPLSSVAVSAFEPDGSPVGTSALNHRAGDPALKIAQILSADDREHKAADLREVGREAAEGDLQDALRLADTMTGEDDRLCYWRGVFEAWGRIDPLAAATYAQTSFPAGGVQSESLRTVLTQWGAIDPRAAYEWSEQNLSGPQKAEAINGLVQGWAAQNPRAAAAWFVQSGSTSQPLLASLVGTWADKAPKEAAAWVETLADPGNRETGRVVAARAWAEKNPAEAAAHYSPAVNEPASAASPKPPGVDLATVLADIWGTSDPAAAAQWVDQLQAGPARQEAAGTLATVWAASDINAAVEWSASLTEPDLRAAVVQHLGTTWGAIEPEKAIAWLQTQPPEAAANGLRGAFNSWAGTDPVGLGEWIQNQPAGPQEDLARRSLGDVLAASDPQAALDLSLGMSTPNAEAEGAARYFRHWRKLDDDGAQEWLAAQWPSLPAPVQQRLTEVQAKPLTR